MMTSLNKSTGYVSPFSGEPRTDVSRLSDTLTYTVRPRELTPKGVKRAEGIGGFVVFFLFLAAFILLAGLKPDQPLAWLGGLMAPLFCYPLFLQMALSGQYREALFEFTPEAFRVRDGRSWRSYDRTLNHRFVMMPHDLARAEEDDREVRKANAQRQGRAINPKRYYAESYHIILQYLGHRVDLMEVYDRKRAMAVLARLKAVDEVMDNEAKMGDGEALSPKDQWGRDTGELPD